MILSVLGLSRLDAIFKFHSCVRCLLRRTLTWKFGLHALNWKDSLNFRIKLIRAQGWESDILFSILSILPTRTLVRGKRHFVSLLLTVTRWAVGEGETEAQVPGGGPAVQLTLKSWQPFSSTGDGVQGGWEHSRERGHQEWCHQAQLWNRMIIMFSVCPWVRRLGRIKMRCHCGSAVSWNTHNQNCGVGFWFVCF